MKKIIVISKMTLVLSTLIMVIAFGLVAFEGDYGSPLIVGKISGAIFLISDIIVAIDAISRLTKKEK